MSPTSALGFLATFALAMAIHYGIKTAVEESRGKGSKGSAWMKKPVTDSNIWPGVVLGYRRTDGTIYTGHARDDWDLEDLDAWAADNSALPDVAEAWVSWTTPEGRSREYWIDGERHRSEDVS